MLASVSGGERVTNTYSREAGDGKTGVHSERHEVARRANCRIDFAQRPRTVG